MTVDDWIREATQKLAHAAVDSPRLEAQLLLSHSLGRPRVWLVAHAGEAIDSGPADELIRRRLTGEPLAYLIGSREFFGRVFRVDPRVLIPRQDTETLVEVALDTLPTEEIQILDVGTGSGCIGVTLALERPAWKVTLSDRSPDALNVAQENALRLGAKVDLIEFDGVPERAWDAIVTNPPYVGVHESLPDEVANYEPSEALYAGENGLDFYRKLATEAQRAKVVLTEIGQGQATGVNQIFVASDWMNLGSWQDLAGITRVLGFKLP